MLVYSSLQPESDIVTTGRKAILRALYADLGDDDTGHVEAILAHVIEREEHMTRDHTEVGTDG